MSSSSPYQVILPLVMMATVIIVGVTVGVVAGTRNRPSALRGSLGPTQTTTTATQGATTTETPTSPPPPVVIPACTMVSRTTTPYNNSLLLPSGATFQWNVDSMTLVVQSFLNTNLIETDAIVSATQDGDRFLVSEINSRRLSSLALDGTNLQDIFAWQFDNVYGLVLHGGFLYALTDTNELLRLIVGQTYAVISARTMLPVPAKYLAIEPNTQQPYVLLTNGTIATISLEDPTAVQSVCTPPSGADYRNIGYNDGGQLVGTLENAIDVVQLV